MTLDQLAAWAVPRAMRLVGTVHDEGVEDTAAVLRGLDADQARALVVVLAAMVDPGKTAGELLAWTDWQAAPRPVRRPAPTGDTADQVAAIAAEHGWTPGEVRSAHARYTAGERDARSVAGHRLYDCARLRAARRRQRLQQAS